MTNETTIQPPAIEFSNQEAVTFTKCQVSPPVIRQFGDIRENWKGELEFSSFWIEGHGVNGKTTKVIVLEAVIDRLQQELALELAKQERKS